MGLSVGLLQAQPAEKTCQQAKQMISQLERHHFESRKLDDRLSEEIFDAFIKRLDPSGFFFLQKDIDRLNIYRHRIDEHINSQKCVFVHQTTRIYRKRLAFVDSVVQSLASQPFDLNSQEQLISSKEISHPADLSALQAKWTRQLRYSVLGFMYQQMDTVVEGTDWQSQEAKSREKAVLKTHCRLQRLLDTEEGFEEYMGKLFLKTLAQRYDPHTVFFSAAGKSAFIQDLAKEGYTFGFDLTENDKNELQLTGLLPGGPAWKTHLLNEGDIVLRIQLSGDEELDLICSNVEEISQKLQSVTVMQVVVEVKKKSGQHRTVRLEKEKMAVQDNVINSFILDGEKKVGYIYLPGFYTNWEGENALGLSNDVAKELLKLQLEGTEGLILDLRHNGGGAIIEALGLAGLFIDSGPLVMGKEPSGEINLLKDLNRGVAYSGPLIVLVDGLSASASEIFAAAMQDYNRAVIVGDTTYGKSSGQQFFPLDERLRNSGGDIKITMEKYYRITGNTYQREGVIPDVVLPQLLEAWTPREKDAPEALVNDRVDKELTYRANPPLPLAQLAQLSRDRLQGDAQFRKLKTSSDSLYADLSKKDIIPLDMTGYFAYRQQIRRDLGRLMSLEERESTFFETKNNRFAESLVQISEIQKLNNETLKAEIQQDIYIEETYRIMLDLIKSK
jgi:carboxyl-terminal processing protease